MFGDLLASVCGDCAEHTGDDATAETESTVPDAPSVSGDGSGVRVTADLAVETAVNLSPPSLAEADPLLLKLIRCTGDG
jgi:hypothetical protein